MGNASTHVDLQPGSENVNTSTIANQSQDDGGRGISRAKRKAPTAAELADSEEGRQLRKQRVEKVKEEPLSDDERPLQSVPTQPMENDQAMTHPNALSAAQDELMIQLLARFGPHQPAYYAAIQHLARASVHSGGTEAGKGYLENALRKLQTELGASERQVKCASNDLLDAWRVEVMSVVGGTIRTSDSLYACAHSFFNAVTPDTPLLPVRWRDRLTLLLEDPDTSVNSCSAIDRKTASYTHEQGTTQSRPSTKRKTFKPREAFLACWRELSRGSAHPGKHGLANTQKLEEQARQSWTSLATNQQRAWRDIGRMFGSSATPDFEVISSGAQLLEDQGLLSQLEIESRSTRSSSGCITTDAEDGPSASPVPTFASSQRGATQTAHADPRNRRQNRRGPISTTTSATRLPYLPHGLSVSASSPAQLANRFSARTPQSTATSFKVEDHLDPPSSGHVLVESFYHSRDGFMVVLFLNTPDTPIDAIDAYQLNLDCSVAFEDVPNYLNVKAAHQRRDNKAWLVKFDRPQAAEQAWRKPLFVHHMNYSVPCEPLPYAPPKLFIWDAAGSAFTDKEVALCLADAFKRRSNRPALLRCQGRRRSDGSNSSCHYVVRFRGSSYLYRFYLQLPRGSYACFKPLQIEAPCVTCGRMHSLGEDCRKSYIVSIPWHLGGM